MNDRPGQRHLFFFHRASGFVLLDALLAGVLLGIVALSAVALVDHALRVGRAAERLDRGREIAERTIRELEIVSFHGLPERFGAAVDDTTARLDTADGSAPSSWSGLAAELPEGRIIAHLEGLGPAAADRAFGAAVALRVTVVVSWREAARRRVVRLVTVRT